jgi:ribose transport system substrate-binding protein
MSEPAGLRMMWRLVPVLAALILALGIAACGDDEDESSGSDSQPAESTTADGGGGEAAAAVDEARQPLDEFTGPDESPGPVPKGKTVVSIFSVPAPLPQRAAQGVAAAAKAIGWKAQVVNGRGTPQGWAAAVDTAITSGADAIVLNAAQPSLIAPQVARAAEAGIPFVSVLSCEANPPTGVVNQVNPDEAGEGERLGQWVVGDAPDGAEILLLNSPEFTCLQQATDGFRKAIADAGSSYEIVEEAVSPAADLTSSKGVQRLSAMLRKNPNAKYFWVLSESWAGILTPAEQTTGRLDVTGLGTDGDFFVPQIQKGANFVMAGPDSLEYGWYAVDALIRAFNDKEPVEYELPFQIIDKTNAKSVEGDGVTNAYDYAAGWTELWGVGG